MRKLRGTPPLLEINVVPYIDVMLVLLMIFMATAPLLQQGVEVRLPEAGAQPLPPAAHPPLIVSVDRRGLYYLNTTLEPEAPIAEVSLVLAVAEALKADPTRAVLVRGDRMVPYGTVLAAMVFLQHAGVQRVGLMTEPVVTRSSERNGL